MASTQSHEEKKRSPIEIGLAEDTLSENMRVRIAQINKSCMKTTLANSKLTVTHRDRQRIMAQVNAATLQPDYSSDDSQTSEMALVIFPELSVPFEERADIINLAKKTNKAILAGLVWHILPTVVKPHASVRGVGKAVSWFVNEAVLAIPIPQGTKRSSPITVRDYTIRKPLPTIMELGLAKALSKMHSSEWRVLPGTRWYRFIHPQWWDFTVAICSDLIDPTPWSSLRGEILHIFQCAYNKDVDLFESLTWVRAYENFANVASVNHGDHGGSFIWTPKHSQGKELAKLRGGNLFLTADVLLPVRDLLVEQCNGLSNAVQSSSKKDWQAKTIGQSKKSKFKSPPPFFRRHLK